MIKHYLTMLSVYLVIGFVFTCSAHAVTTFSPSQAELYAVDDVTMDGWGGGGSLYTGPGTFYGLVGADAVRYDMDFQPTPPPTGDGFSRVVLQNTSFHTDLTGYDRFDILFQTEDLQEMKVRTYLYTGPSGYYSSELTSSFVTDYDPTRITIDLTSVPDLNDVRGFGIQMLVPGNPTAIAQTALVQTAPPFVQTQMVEVLNIDSFERTELATGLNGDGWAHFTFVPGPTESNTTFVSTTVGATDGTYAAKFVRAGGANSPFKWSMARVWTSNGEGRPDPLDAVNDDPDDTVVPIIPQEQVELTAAAFNEATHLAFDLTYDTADFGPEVTYAKLAVVINDSTGAWYQKGGDLGFVNPQFLGPGTTTLHIELPLDNLIAAGSALVPSGTPFSGIFMGGPNPADPGGDPLPASDIISLGFATVIGDENNQSVAGAAIIDNLRLLKRIIVPDLPGDLNNDGFVGLADLDIVLNHWNQNVPIGDLPSGDVAPDGFIGLADLDIVLVNWNTGTPPANVLPEPTTLTILVLGATALSSRRRWHA